MASALAGALVVWDGRLVVDAGFSSSVADGSVMGAGPVAKFSRRYVQPDGVWQEQHDSSELGVRLADAILARIAAPGGAASGAGAAATAGAAASRGVDQLPELTRAKVVSCRLPGGLVFGLAGCPAAIAAPMLEPPPGGCSLLSTSTGADGGRCLVNICLDARSIITNVACLGQLQQLQRTPSLAGLVGLPFSYLGAGLSLPDRLAAQLQGPSSTSMLQDVLTRMQDADGVFVLKQDVLAALRQPWAQLLLNEDVLPALRRELLRLPAAQVEGASDDEAAMEGLQVQALQLMQRCAADLPATYKLAMVAGPSGAAVVP